MKAIVQFSQKLWVILIFCGQTKKQADRQTDRAKLYTQESSINLRGIQTNRIDFPDVNAIQLTKGFTRICFSIKG